MRLEPKKLTNGQLSRLNGEWEMVLERKHFGKCLEREKELFLIFSVLSVIIFVYDIFIMDAIVFSVSSSRYTFSSLVPHTVFRTCITSLSCLSVGRLIFRLVYWFVCHNNGKVHFYALFSEEFLIPIYVHVLLCADFMYFFCRYV